MRQLNTGLSLIYTAAILCVLPSATVLTGCGGPSSDTDPLDMLLDDTVIVFAYDIEAVSAGEAGDAIEEKIADYWDSPLGAMGILVSEAESLTVGRRMHDGYTMVKGEFDFEFIRDDLDDNGYYSGDYRGYEVWTGGGLRDASTVALIEEDGLVLAGSDDAVQDILRNLARDLSARDGAMRETLRTMDTAGKGWVVLGLSECGDDLRGCEAVGFSITPAKRYELRVTEVVLFHDERTAESQMDEIEARAEDDDSGIMLEELTLEDETVIVVGSIDEDEFADRVTMERGLLSW